MKVALHYRNLVTPPEGIWWADPAVTYVQHHYLNEEDPLAIRGKEILGTKVATVTWERFFDCLADRQPYFDVWQSAQIDHVWTPPEYLKMMREVAFSLLSDS